MNETMNRPVTLNIDRNANNECISVEPDDRQNMFQLVWSNLSLSLSVKSETEKTSLWKNFNGQVEEKTVLQPMSGTIASGTLTALMGPSGAGKSTLLNVITGKLKSDATTHIGGQCFLRAHMSSPVSSKNCKISFVPQRDNLFRSFTVRETILFSSKLNNPQFSSNGHEKQIINILKSLRLIEVADFPLSNLSGGQLKRVTIANEMIASPAILVLDEPTSGLDSDSAESLVRLLREMSRSPPANFFAPAIIATIHSPSFDMFTTFDSIYLLSKGGCNIYNGAPEGIIDFLGDFGFKDVPGNPADFAIEVANGKYGDSYFRRMQQLALTSVDAPAAEKSDIDMQEFTQETRSSTGEQIWQLTTRSLASCMIKSPQSLIIMLMHLATGLLLVHLPNQPVGADPICWEYFKPWDQIDRSNFTASDLIYEVKLQLDNGERMKTMSVVTNFIYFSTSYLMFIHATIAAVLMPFEMPVVRRELTNNYYTVKSYFLSKLFCDMLVIVATTLPAALYLYFVSGQLSDVDNLWRLAMYAAVFFVTALTWHLAGLSVGLYVPDILFAIAVVVAIVLTNMFLSEFFVSVSLMAWWCSFIPTIMPIQASFSLFIAILYGFNRCDISGTLKTISLTGFDQPSEAFAKLWWHLNFEYEDMRRQAVIYDTEVGYMYSLYDYIVKWIGPKRTISYATPNYLLDYYHVTEDLSQHLTVDILWLVILIGTFWHALSTRSKLTRL